MKPKFHAGERIAVNDYEAIKRYRGNLPLVGWVDHCEEIRDGKRHIGWWVLLCPDDPDQPMVRYRQDDVTRIEVKRYGKRIRNSDSITCPYCSVLGRDPRWPPSMPAHPPLSACTCWWHTHKEHMPRCPFGGRGEG